MLAEYMEHTFCAVRHSTRAAPSAGQHSCCRANTLAPDMADIGLAPVVHRIGQFVRRVACVPGPNCGSAVGGACIEYQVRLAFRNTACAKVVDACIKELTYILKSDGWQLLHMTKLDLLSMPNGAVHTSAHGSLKGLLGGHRHLGYYGMRFHPQSGNQHMEHTFEVMGADLDFVYPSVYFDMVGGADRSSCHKRVLQTGMPCYLE